MEKDRPARGSPLQALARHGAGAEANAVLDQFRAALIARNIIPPDPIVADGQLHRSNVRIPLIADTHSRLITDSVPGDRGRPGWGT